MSNNEKKIRLGTYKIDKDNMEGRLIANLSDDEALSFNLWDLLPIPCDIYMDRPLSEFGRKMAEEDYEATEAIGQYIADPNEENRMMLAMELTDKITAATSTLQRIGCDINERARLQRAVNERNKERGRFRGVE